MVFDPATSCKCRAKRECLPLRTAAVYLGHVIGPGKEATLWEAPLRKFASRIAGWRWAELGLHFAALAYNVFAASALTFTAQLALPSEEALAAEAWALRRAAPGPGQWAVPADLWMADRLAGLPRPFACLADTALAAQARAGLYENRRRGGLQLRAMVDSITRAWQRSDHLERLARWAGWLRLSGPMVLQAAPGLLAAEGVMVEGVVQRLADAPVGRPSAEALEMARPKLQGAIRAALAARRALAAPARAREKLQRWNLPVLPRRLGDRFVRQMARLRELVPPRVAAASFSVAWNRWCTARRFQRRDALSNFCQLGCGGDAEDSLEHYGRCRVLRTFHSRHLALHHSWLFPWWIGAAEEQSEADALVAGALGAYVAYRATNAARAHGGFVEAVAHQALSQALLEAHAGHAACGAALARWRGLPAARAARRVRQRLA